jgi:hypothetical protein
MLEDFKGGRLGNWRNNDFSIISFTCMDMWISDYYLRFQTAFDKGIMEALREVAGYVEQGVVNS